MPIVAVILQLEKLIKDFLNPTSKNFFPTIYLKEFSATHEEINLRKAQAKYIFSSNN